MSDVPHISASHLCVTLAGAEILKSISLEIHAGELVGLIGPNGAGKSTLLRALLGLVPYEGLVSAGNADLKDVPLKERARMISYAPQGAPVHWPMTVEALVGLGRVPHQTPFEHMSSEDLAVVAEALDATDSHHLKDRIVTSLSGGERAGVLLARAMAVEAPYLFADEPVASLDPFHCLNVMDLLKRLSQSGVGVVVVLHDLNLALRYCDRICLMDNGALTFDGPAEALPDALLAETFKVEISRGAVNGLPALVTERRT